MSTDSIVEWNGDALKELTELAARRAMDRVMTDCVVIAKELAPRKSAALQGSIQMRPTVRQGRGLVGYWGSFGINYAIYRELGTGIHGGKGMYEIRPRRRKALFWPGAEYPVKVVHHPGVRAKPFLRPAADTVYPGLPQYIREEMGT